MQSRITHDRRVVVATHELFYGASNALRDYLVEKKVGTLVFLSHPIRAENPLSTSQHFKAGKKVEDKKELHKFSGTILGYGIDMLSNLRFLMRERQRFDMYIGINPLNCLVGLILKKLRKVDYVIFYSIDFIPRRFNNFIINLLYHSIESYCVRFADERWNVSPRIAEGRETFLHLSAKHFFQKVVPIGLWNHEIMKRSHGNKRGHNTIVFVGHLLEKQGVQMVLHAMPAIIKHVPDARMIIIGGGEYEKELRDLSKHLKLGSRVEFTGWMHDQEKVRKILGTCDVAVATYDTRGQQSYNFSYYGDPTKIKTYLSCQLPVVMTDVSYNAKELSRKGCAVIVDYTKQTITRALVTLLLDKQKLTRMKRRALDTIKEYTWENIFNLAFSHET